MACRFWRKPTLRSGYTKYTFDVVADRAGPTTQLFFDFSGDGTGLLVDQISISPTPGPAVETASGSIAFSDIETGDTHTASFVPQGSGYVGTFSLDPVSEAGGTGTVGWQFSVDNADIQFLGQGETLVQSYTVMIDDGRAAPYADRDRRDQRHQRRADGGRREYHYGRGPSGLVQIQPWMLAANDTDPDLTDNLAFGSIQSSSGGSAVTFGDVFFGDDATAGGSFTYRVSDGIATSGNAATATVINNATSATSLNGTSGDDIIIATNGTETLSGGAGNDILVGNAGSHVMSGGSGNDTFRIPADDRWSGYDHGLQHTTEQDHIAISAAVSAAR
jgi:VCBS repeat-containing protein